MAEKSVVPKFRPAIDRKMPPVLGTLAELENETTAMSYVMTATLVPTTAVTVAAVKRATPLTAAGLTHVIVVAVVHDDDEQIRSWDNCSVAVVSVIPKLYPSCEIEAPPDPGPFAGAVDVSTGESNENVNGRVPMNPET